MSSNVTSASRSDPNESRRLPRPWARVLVGPDGDAPLFVGATGERLRPSNFWVIFPTLAGRTPRTPQPAQVATGQVSAG